MTRPALCGLLLLAAAGLGFARPPSPASPQPSWTLPRLLQSLDAAAPSIVSVSADAAVADYTALVQDTTRSSGTFYYKRAASGPMYALDLTQPADAAKQFVYRDQTAYVYTPSSHEVFEYPLANRAQLADEFLLLGVGSTGADLSRSFVLALDGAPTLDGVPTVELTLTPRAAGGKITHIDLWYDTRTWIVAQQQIWELGGDYHLVHYTHVHRNPSIPDRRFPTHFDNATVVTPQL